MQLLPKFRHCTRVDHYGILESHRYPEALVLISARSERNGLRWDDVSLGVLLAQEYDRLKEEQNHRISTRDNLMYATLVSIAGVVVGTYQAGSVDLLLLLPPVCVVLGWTYLVNDEKVSAIGRYIRTDLGPRLGALVGAGQPVFRWEGSHRSDRRRRSRKMFQLVIDLTTFCLPGMIAVIIRCMHGNLSILSTAAVALEILMLLFLAHQVTVYADLTRDKPPSAADADADADAPGSAATGKLHQ
ncbi:hypothetical protein [Plantactinospora sp. KLBMP9567]|uniref:hypothetical protein n=1 Tax=Plantactinospora sp. KLBMP9567 TaxID=3085900 RepID=UPI002981ED3A|nr:hypothetical protein [Plantactinospora sp. KLBMP9567]